MTNDIERRQTDGPSYNFSAGNLSLHALALILRAMFFSFGVAGTYLIYLLLSGPSDVDPSDHHSLDGVGLLVIAGGTIFAFGASCVKEPREVLGLTVAALKSDVLQIVVFLFAYLCIMIATMIGARWVLKLIVPPWVLDHGITTFAVFVFAVWVPIGLSSLLPDRNKPSSLPDERRSPTK